MRIQDLPLGPTDVEGGVGWRCVFQSSPPLVCLSKSSGLRSSDLGLRDPSVDDYDVEHRAVVNNQQPGLVPIG